MRNAAIIGICLVCFLAGAGVGAGVALMTAGRDTTSLSETERILAAETGYAEGWNDGYETRRREEAIANEGRPAIPPPVNSTNDKALHGDSDDGNT